MLFRSVPKSGFEVYVEPVKQSIVVPKVIKQVEHVSCVIIEEYVEAPPYPNQVKENLLIAVTNKSNRRCAQPYEQVEVNSQISVIKQLNEEDPIDVYLCEDATKVIKGNSAKVGNLLYHAPLGLQFIMACVILEQVLVSFHILFILKSNLILTLSLWKRQV